MHRSASFFVLVLAVLPLALGAGACALGADGDVDGNIADSDDSDDSGEPDGHDEDSPEVGGDDAALDPIPRDAPDDPSDTPDLPSVDADPRDTTDQDTPAEFDTSTADADVPPDTEPGDVRPDGGSSDADAPDAEVTRVDADAPDAEVAPADADAPDAEVAPGDVDADVADSAVDAGPDPACLAPRVALPAASPITIAWVDVTELAGIAGVQWPATESFETSPCGEASILSGGAAIEDYDDDGDLDIFYPGLAVADRLFRNEGDGTFVDVAPALGLDAVGSSNSAAWVDIDGDGDLDLFVGALAGEPNRLWVQRSPTEWVDEAEERGVALSDPTHRPRDCGHVFGVSFADADGDGDLDLYISRWIPSGRLWGSFYMRNDGGGYFREVTEDVGLYLEARSVLFMSSWFDFDDDGDMDLLATGDFGNSHFFDNLGDGSWGETTARSGLGTDENGMGTSVGDIDMDGDLDVFVTAIYGESRTECGMSWGCSGNRMYINQGDNVFVDCTDEYGVRDGGWGWGTAMFDADLDGDLDLAMTSGYWIHWPNEGLERIRSTLLRYRHGGMRFFENDGVGPMPERSTEQGLVHARRGRALIPFDRDGDGDLDIFVVSNIEPPRIFDNQGAEARHWLRVQLRDAAPNTRAIGATVWAQMGPERAWVRRDIAASGAFLATLPFEAHFGFGDDSAPVALRVRWPDGTLTTHEGVAPDQVLRITRP